MTTSESEPGDDGFSVVRGVLPSEVVGALITSLDVIGDRRTRAGARHLMRISAIREAASDPRLLEIARRFVGPSPVPFRATLFDKSLEGNWLIAWHQDTALPLRERIDRAGWGPWSTKAGVTYAHAPAEALEHVIALRVLLDDSATDNGPLRVLPGTHRLGVLADQSVAELAAQRAAIECLAPSGSVIAMRPLIVHASTKSRSSAPRRVLHIEYAESAELDGCRLEIV